MRWLCPIMVVFVTVLFGGELKEVVVEGKAAGTDEAAYDAALQAALRAAVEQGCGVFVTSKSEVRDYQLAYDLILTESRGYIASYEVLERRNDGRFTFVKIRAQVSLDELKEDWATLKFLLRQKGNPTFVVAVRDLIDGNEQDTAYAETEIIGYMASHDITCVNSKVAQEAFEREWKQARIMGDKNRLAILAKRVKADIVITGTVNAIFVKDTFVERIGKRRVWYKSVITLQAVRTDDGIVVASFNKTLDLGARGCGSSRKEAAQKALGEGAKAAAEEALKKILSAWSRELLRGTTMHIEVRNTDYAALTKLVNSLNRVRFTSDATVESFDNGTGIIRFRTPFTSHKFLQRLTRAKAVDPASVVGLSGSKITIDMSKVKK